MYDLHPLVVVAVDANYQKTNKYKYAKAVTPAFSGAEAEIMRCIKSVISYCSIRGIPNYFSYYLQRRKLPETFDQEHQEADHEVYSLMEGWFTGTAQGFVDSHMMIRSAHAVWRDLVERFLKQSNDRRSAVRMELEGIRYKDKDHKTESIPQFFNRLRLMAMKLQAVGGSTDQSSLVCTATVALMSHPKLRGIVDQLKTQNPDFDTFTMEAALLEKGVLYKSLKRRKAQDDAEEALAHVQSQLARAEAHNATMRDHSSNPYPYNNQRNTYPHKVTFKKPWEQQQQRNAHDRTGIGHGRDADAGVMLMRIVTSTTDPAG